MVLGMVIERISGLTYDECLHRYLGQFSGSFYVGYEKKDKFHAMEVNVLYVLEAEPL